MKVKFSKKFFKNYDKAPVRTRTAFDKRLQIFLQDKFHPTLRNHALIGGYKGYRSINVTGDWRAIFRELDDEKWAFAVFDGRELVFVEGFVWHVRRL